jgi:thioredoxin reductase (NADPH)
MSETEVRNVVILGTGCAGLTAGIYTARANLRPLLFSGRMPGGLLTTTSVVENFPGFPEGVDGNELMLRMEQQAVRFGAEVLMEEVKEVDLSRRPFRVIHGGGEVFAKALIIATGARHKHLGLESERLLDKRGVTYCATCDGALPMFRNQPLVVVGGGDTAMEEALYLTRFASKVHVVHRRDSLRASKIMQERAFANNKIAFHWNRKVDEIFGVNVGKVTGVRLRSTDSDVVEELECAGVFVAIGLAPNTEIFGDLLRKDSEGYLLPEPGSTKMNIRGVFACGDVVDRTYRQAVTAAGSGCAAAIDAERFLSLEN